MRDWTKNLTPEQITKIRKAVEVAENDKSPLLSTEEVKANLKAYVREYKLANETLNAN